MGLVREVIGIDTDAVSADKSRLERQEVPFGFRRRQNVMGRQADLVADHGEFVDEGDVDVALGVFDHLGRFGRFDIGRPEHPAGRNRVVNSA